MKDVVVSKGGKGSSNRWRITLHSQMFIWRCFLETLLVLRSSYQWMKRNTRSEHKRPSDEAFLHPLTTVGT